MVGYGPRATENLLEIEGWLIVIVTTTITIQVWRFSNAHFISDHLCRKLVT